MALIRILSLTTVLTALSISCAPAPPPHEGEQEPIAVTRWTDRTELFAEYPPLVAGETSRFAIHLTSLDTFRPFTSGRVEVRLQRDDGVVDAFGADGPSRPGIFGVDVTPTAPGSHALVVILEAPGLEDVHHVGTVSVHADRDQVPADGLAEEEPEGIGFLKEQQWILDFATEVVTAASLRESFSAPGRVEPRPGGAADVTAPVGGRLVRVLDVPPGTEVAAGQELARLQPPPAVPGDRPQIARDVADARSAHALAVIDRERAERLVTAGAVPGRRLDEARAAETQALIRLEAAAAILGQYDAARTAGDTDVDGLFVVRAPVAGVVAAREAATGVHVAPGTRLFRIVDASQVLVVAEVAEADVPRIGRVAGAELETPGHPRRVTLGRPVSIGRVLDARARTLPVTFSLDNRTLGLPIGQSVSLHLMTDEASPRPVVPVSALVDDGGLTVVFVQIGGETFVRRPVTPGARSGDRMQLLDGIEPGERVVTRGAHLVRLAALSATVPAHGHVH